MSDLLHQLGIDWKLLASQGVNFLILLVALTYLVWRPLLNVMKDRRIKIEEGLKVTDEAEERLRSIDKLKEEKSVEADREALRVVTEAEARGNEKKGEIIENAEKMTDALLKSAQEQADRQAKAEEDRIMRYARELVTQVVSKYTDLDPSKIDEKLVTKALAQLKKERV
ncbi:MAG: hypothetical protein O2794_01700 [bacterium]|nr:hypothetical protein [bacterium]